MTLVLFGLVVLVSSFAYDWANARFMQAVAAGNPARAARWSVATTMVGLVGLTGILKYSYWLLIPEIIGIAAGTYHGVKSAPRAPEPYEQIVVVVQGEKEASEEDDEEGDEASPSVN